MEFVLFSEFITLYDFIANVRLVNKEYYRLSELYFKLYKKNILHKKGRNVKHTRPLLIKCMNCDKLRSCRSDSFCSVQGYFCFDCQASVLCLTKVRKYLDKNIIDSLDCLEWSGGTYFLKRDVEASDFLFNGPNDRRIRRELNSENRVQQRFQKIQNIYLRHDIVLYGKQFNYCRFVNAFIYTGKYGIRAIRSLIEKCYR